MNIAWNLAGNLGILLGTTIRFPGTWEPKWWFREPGSHFMKWFREPLTLGHGTEGVNGLFPGTMTLSLSLCLSVSLSFSLLLSLSLCLSLLLSFSLSLLLSSLFSIYHSLYLSLYLSIFLFLCLCVHVRGRWPRPRRSSAAMLKLQALVSFLCVHPFAAMSSGFQCFAVYVTSGPAAWSIRRPDCCVSDSSMSLGAVRGSLQRQGPCESRARTGTVRS